MAQTDLFSLPLFPLGTVLYPGQLLPLFIFEERYKTMINQCLAEESPFGIVLIKKGQEVGTPAEPYEVGTVARILQVQDRDEGKMYIIAIGVERFTIRDYSVSADGYLVGMVSKLATDQTDPVLLTKRVTASKDLLADYLALTADPDDAAVQEIQSRLAAEPEPLSYQIASILNIDLVEKQSLLELTDAGKRLEREIRILHREIELLKLDNGPRIQKLPWGGEVNLN